MVVPRICLSCDRAFGAPSRFIRRCLPCRIAQGVDTPGARARVRPGPGTAWRRRRPSPYPYHATSRSYSGDRLSAQLDAYQCAWEEARHWGALIDAVVLCTVGGTFLGDRVDAIPPSWLVAALDALLTDRGLSSVAAQVRAAKNRAFPRDLGKILLEVVWGEATRPRGRGRGTRWTDRHRQDLIDYAVADAVELNRAHGLRERDALQMAAEWFARSTVTQARGSLATMRARWLRCRRRLLREPWRYYQSRTSREFLDRVDPPLVSGPNTTPEQRARVAKWRDLFRQYFPAGRGLYDWEDRYWA